MKLLKFKTIDCRLCFFQGQQFQYSMNYNELTYYHANPFYKQDFLPNRAWYNREPKAYPSEMPSGKDFFTDNGRKHFTYRFNHSEIQQQDILKSPERYPFQNRIAMDKTYMRSLQTIDIEGASSNTRINQSIKNKLKAQDQLSRRYNQSVEPKHNTEEQKRRQYALKHYSSVKERSQNKISDEISLQQSRLSKAENSGEGVYSPTKAQLSNQYKRYVMQSSSNKYNKTKPVAEYPEHLRIQSFAKNSQTLDPSYSREYSVPSAPSVQSNQRYRQNPQYEQGLAQKNQSQTPKQQAKKMTMQPEKPTSYYKNQFNGQKLRQSEQYQKILKYQEMNRRMLQNPKDFRKSNPTNLSLSFNLAGQNIVSN